MSVIDITRPHRGRTIVYTCGVFDMFHVGHLNMLRSAAGLGDKLIVGVSTDALVEDYKPGTLVVPFEQRLEIVRAIRCVDECIPQENRDKYEAWTRLKYDVLVQGDEWYDTPDFRRYDAQLSEVGVKVIYIPYTPNVSSSRTRGVLEGRGRRKVQSLDAGGRPPRSDT